MVSDRLRSIVTQASGELYLLDTHVSNINHNRILDKIKVTHHWQADLLKLKNQILASAEHHDFHITTPFNLALLLDVYATATTHSLIKLDETWRDELEKDPPILVDGDPLSLLMVIVFVKELIAQAIGQEHQNMQGNSTISIVRDGALEVNITFAVHSPQPVDLVLLQKSLSADLPVASLKTSELARQKLYRSARERVKATSEAGYDHPTGIVSVNISMQFTPSDILPVAEGL